MILLASKMKEDSDVDIDVASCGYVDGAADG